MDEGSPAGGCDTSCLGAADGAGGVDTARPVSKGEPLKIAHQVVKIIHCRRRYIITVNRAGIVQYEMVSL